MRELDSPRREESWGHGTQKPVEAMRRPIVNNSRPGELVYDPFLGSGTSLIAAETTGRRGTPPGGNRAVRGRHCLCVRILRSQRDDSRLQVGHQPDADSVSRLDSEPATMKLLALPHRSEANGYSAGVPPRRSQRTIALLFLAKTSSTALL